MSATLIAKARMDSAPYSPHIIYAEIFFMTGDELKEFWELRRIAVLAEGSAEDARQRIIKRRGLSENFR